MRSWTTTRVKRAIALGFACLAPWSVSVAAGQGLCGATIVEDLRLDHDLVCAGDGLIVGADDITIDLNGHAHYRRRHRDRHCRDRANRSLD